jgi:alpha-galactosidase
MLRKLLPPSGVAARFDDDSFRVGRVQLGGRAVVSVLNWTNEPQDISISLPRRCRIKDFWSDVVLGTHSGTFTINDMPARSGRLLICE